ncbi:MAG: hypothetical protein HPZ91_05490 [Lentisphaeria bacterium]|nr:hypothetical protein [Lentisphaeria bacterium]
METLEDIGKLLSILIPILSGMVWMLRRIEKGQARMFEKMARIDKHKVSYKVCDRRRAECFRRRGRIGKAAAAAMCGVLFLLAGCSVTINSSGDGADFELSPAREVYTDADVMNGLTSPLANLFGKRNTESE